MSATRWKVALQQRHTWPLFSLMAIARGITQSLRLADLAFGKLAFKDSRGKEQQGVRIVFAIPPTAEH